MSEGGVKISRRQFPAVVASLSGMAVGTYYGLDRLHEVVDNKSISTPEGVDAKLAELSQQNISELVRKGKLSSLAVSSSVKIDFDFQGRDTNWVEEGNGAVFYDRVGDERFWFVHASGHVAQHFGKNNLYLSRPSVLDLKSFNMSFSGRDFGLYTIDLGLSDFGCFAFRDSQFGQYFREYFAPSDVIYKKDILFTPVSKIGTKFNSFSVMDDGQMVPNVGMSFNLLESTSTNEIYGQRNLVLDNFIAKRGFSGVHVFDSETNLCVGITNTLWRPKNVLYKDNVAISPYSRLGIEGLNEVHRKAVESLG